MHQLRQISLVVALLSVAKCSPDISPDTYSLGAVQQAAKVDRGIIIGLRQIDVSASPDAATATGAAAGGIAGSQAPGGGVGAAMGALGGTVIGGIVGTAAGHAAADTTAYEYVVRETKGDLVSVTQKDAKPLPIGQKVLVIAGKQARIVPDYTVDVETPPTAPPAKPDGSPINLPPVSLAAPGTPATATPPTP
jgi:outer membrane lipoprotein SlyB